MTNLFDESHNAPRLVSWKFLLESQTAKDPDTEKVKVVKEYPYHFELILPFKAPEDVIRDGKYKGAVYIAIAAYVLTSQEVKGATFPTGERIIVSFPKRTFVRAWQMVSWQFRKTFTPGENLRIKFVKESKQSMFFTFTEKSSPTQEHIEFAQQVYAGGLAHEAEMD